MYPENIAIKTWKNGIATCFIVKHPSLGHYCGYASFAKKPVKTPDYGGILSYVPVHGGITYAEPRDDGSIVYGFDCAHLNDERNPLLRDLDYLTAECEAMAFAIAEAAKFEAAYEAASDDDRAGVVDKYHAGLRKYGMRFDLLDNFGAMINVLMGKV